MPAGGRSRQVPGRGRPARSFGDDRSGRVARRVQRPRRCGRGHGCRGGLGAHPRRHGREPRRPGSILIWGCFAWIAVTASGPFLLLVRLYARRLPDYPKVGDRLWALIGLPWILTRADPPRGDVGRRAPPRPVRDRAERGPRGRLADRPRRRLGDVGHGEPATGGPDLVGPLDEPGRPGPGGGLAHPVRDRPGRDRVRRASDRRTPRGFAR